MAETLRTPRPSNSLTQAATPECTEQPDRATPPDKDGTETPVYTAAEVLQVALAAYQRGLDDATSQAGRNRWSNNASAAAYRAARIQDEVALMKAVATSGYLSRGYPNGYDYKGGPVDFETGLPAGSGCAWLRHQRARTGYDLAGGDQ